MNGDRGILAKESRTTKLWLAEREGDWALHLLREFEADDALFLCSQT